MKVAFFDSRNYEKEFYAGCALDIHWFSARLNINTIELARGYDAVCCFVEDNITKEVLELLKEFGVRLVALRCAGYNNVDVEAAKELGIPVVRVPAYSPQAVAEFSLGLLLNLNRKIHKAYNRVREGNLSLNGLVGFELKGKTIGVLGAGKIGSSFCHLLSGFDCEILAYDNETSPELKKIGVKYIDLNTLLEKSHVISLHLPLNPNTHHILNDDAFGKMREDVVLINTSRGGLVDTKALIRNLKNKKVLAAGLDVYEEEEGLFFHDHSEDIILDDQYARLMTFPNVILTSHQAFLTKEALESIAKTSIENIQKYFEQNELQNNV